MSESVITAAPQPPPSTANSGVANEVGENMSGSAVRAMLFSKDMARQTAPAPAEVQAPATTPKATAETQPPTDSTAEDATTNAPDSEQPTEAEGEQPDAEAESSEDVLSHLSSLDPKTRLILQKAIEDQRKRDQDKIDKRIGKERAKRGAVEQQLKEAQIREQTLSAQLRQPQQTQAPTPQPAFDSNQPLADVQDAQTLSKRAQEAKETVRYVNEVLDTDGIENGIEINGKVWSKADLKAARRNAQITLEDHVPQRQAFLQQRQQSVAAAVEKFSFLKDEAHPGYAKAQAIVANPQYSWLRTVSNAAELLGNLVEGELAVESRRKAAAPVKPVVTKPRPASDQTVTSVAASGGDRSTAGKLMSQVAAERERLNAQGNVTGADLRSFLKMNDQFRQ